MRLPYKISSATCVPSAVILTFVNFWIGTSGFQYAEWKGNFYPEDLPASKMLPFYAERFSTTEINYTFHRVPAPKTIDNWKTLTPEKFRFALKAPQKITHWSKLKDCADTLEYFCKVVTGLDERLGPVLFQLPPRPELKQDRTESFVEAGYDFAEIFQCVGAILQLRPMGDLLRRL